MGIRFSVTCARSLALALCILVSPLVRAQTVVQFDVPAQSLADALGALANQADLNILIDRSLVAGRQAPALKARVTAAEALAQLLQGSGISYRFVDEHTVTLHAQAPAEDSAQAPVAPATSAVAPADTAPSHQEMTQLEEVLVTATKRSTRLIDTPAQVNAIGADYLSKSKVQQFADLSGSLPNFLAPEGLTGTSNVTIRGLSSPARGGNIAEQPVSAYIDGVFAPEGSLDGLIYDIRQIEIIRGPQGVIWGRNTLAGAISFTSERPTRNFEGYAEAGMGSQNLIEARGAISGPLVEDKLLLRFAAAHQQRDGYSRRISGGTYGEVDRQAARVTVQFLPNDVLDIVLINDYSQNEFTSVVPEYFMGPLAEIAGTDGFTRRSDTDLFGPNHVKSYGSTAIATYDLGGATLSSTTGYRMLELNQLLDSDGSAQFLVHGVAESALDQFSQELRIASDTNGGALLDWMAGVYFYQRTNRFGQSEMYGPPVAVLRGAPAGSTMQLQTHNRDQIQSQSAFGTLTWHLTERLSLQGGLRVTRDEKKNSARVSFSVVAPGDVAPPLSGPAVNLDLDENQISPLVGIAYKPTDDSLIYASWGRGHKSGGFNSERVSRPTFGPEEAESYELGYKAAWLDDRLSLNLAGFYIDYSDLQVRNLDGVDPLFVNAGRARSEGVELELNVRPSASWQVSGSFGYTDAKFEDFILGGGGSVPGDDLAGNRLPYAPKTSLSLRSEYTVPVGTLGEMYLHCEWNRVGDYFLDLKNRRQGYQPAYDLANARIGLMLESGLQIALWGRNLTDEDYRVDFFGDLPAFVFGDSAMQILGPSRSYGADVKFKF